MRRGRMHRGGYGRVANSNNTNNNTNGKSNIIEKALWRLLSSVANDLLSPNSKIKKIGQKVIAKLSISTKKPNKEITNAKYKVIEGDKK